MLLMHLMVKQNLDTIRKENLMVNGSVMTFKVVSGVLEVFILVKNDVCSRKILKIS